MEGQQLYISKQYLKLWIRHALARLPLKGSLVIVVTVTLVLFTVIHLFGFLETQSQAIVVSHVRHRNIKLGTKPSYEDDEDVPVKDSIRLMTVQLHGRTGNMMFAYASLLGLAKQTARTPVFPGNHYFRTLFQIKAEHFSRTDIKSWVKYAEKHACMYDERLANMGETSADMVELVGYFQSWKYFAHIRDEVKAQFTFQNEIQEQASSLIESAIKRTFDSSTRRADVTLIGVHVRRGDVATYDSFLLGYTTASSEYITDAMQYFGRRFRRSKLLFLLCSDDFEWCEKNVKEVSGPIARLKNASDVTHLAALSLCNHTIITVGSFGWWGAWLAGGETVYYKNFPRPTSPLSTDFYAKDYYYPGWLGM